MVAARLGLARKAGGWGMQKRTADGKPAGEMVEIFQDTDDPDYRAILNFIEMGRLCLEKNKRWDMPGFKPHPFYVREMKRYGILPETFDPARDDVDVFQIDRRYWASTWHYPDGGGPTLYTSNKGARTLFGIIGNKSLPAVALPCSGTGAFSDALGE